jgi:hypothetical protein
MWKLTVTPDGTLSIVGEKGRHALAPGEWDDLELKMPLALDKTSLDIRRSARPTKESASATWIELLRPLRSRWGLMSDSAAYSFTLGPPERENGSAPRR